MNTLNSAKRPNLSSTEPVTFLTLMVAPSIVDRILKDLSLKCLSNFEQVSKKFQAITVRKWIVESFKDSTNKVTLEFLLRKSWNLSDPFIFTQFVQVADTLIALQPEKANQIYDRLIQHTDLQAFPIENFHSLIEIKLNLNQLELIKFYLDTALFRLSKIQNLTKKIDFTKNLCELFLAHSDLFLKSSNIRFKEYLNILIKFLKTLEHNPEVKNKLFLKIADVTSRLAEKEKSSIERALFFESASKTYDAYFSSSPPFQMEILKKAVAVSHKLGHDTKAFSYYQQALDETDPSDHKNYLALNYEAINFLRRIEDYSRAASKGIALLEKEDLNQASEIVLFDILYLVLSCYTIEGQLKGETKNTLDNNKDLYTITEKYQQGNPQAFEKLQKRIRYFLQR